jgi:LAGLIDADG DNA endonuclease family
LEPLIGLPDGGLKARSPEQLNQFLTIPKPSRSLTKAERSQFTLSEELKQILVGLLLGDLYAQKQKSYANARLFFQQGLVHEQYLFHLYELFETYSSQAPKITNLPPDKRTGKVYNLFSRVIVTSLRMQRPLVRKGTCLPCVPGRRLE